MRSGWPIRFFLHPSTHDLARGGLVLALGFVMLACGDAGAAGATSAAGAAGAAGAGALPSSPVGGISSAPALPTGALPWWVWSAGVFAAALLIGVVAVPAGVGGGVLFVPIVGGFFPFHLDFVRGAGLLIALTGALASAPALLRHGLGNLRLALPLAFAAALGAIAGARLGLALPDRLLQLLLGLLILGIVALMLRSAPAGAPGAEGAPWAREAGLGGRLLEPGAVLPAEWLPARLPPAILAFLIIGVVAGVFGLGAGWANVPVLNLLMAVPLRAAAGTSGLVLSMTSPAALVYLGQGAMLAPIAVPAVLGVTLGAVIGVRLLRVLPARVIRRLVILMLLAAAARALQRGLA
jgi:uncharacterized membrane protein YfcA